MAPEKASSLPKSYQPLQIWNFFIFPLTDGIPKPTDFGSNPDRNNEYWEKNFLWLRISFFIYIATKANSYF